MTSREQGNANRKTCPACGGTWPEDRRHCLACGANLESVPVQPAGKEQAQQPLSWTWLEAMADEGASSGTPEPVHIEQRPGCLARLFPA